MTKGLLFSILFFAAHVLASDRSITVDCSTNGSGQYVITLDNTDTSKDYDAIFSIPRTGKTKKIELHRQKKTTYTVGKNLCDTNQDKVIELVIPNYYGHDNNFSYTCHYELPAYTVEPTAPPHHFDQTHHFAAAKDSSQNQGAGKESQLGNTKIDNYADQQARTVANRIAESFGRQERYKASLVSGLNSGYSLNRVFTLSNSEYSRGFEVARSAARRNAESIAVQTAKKDADQQAQQTARAKHVAAVFQNGYVDPSFTRPIETFRPSAVLTDVSFTLKAELANKQRDLWTRMDRELRATRFGDELFSVLFDVRDDFTLSTILGLDGHYEFVDSYFKDERAWREWQENGLGGKYDFNLYKKMGLAEKTRFESQFKSVYRTVLRDKILAKLNERDSQAYERGLFWGLELAKEESYLHGYSDGLSSALEREARAIYDNAFETEYERRFHDWMRHYENSAELSFELKLEKSNTPGCFSLTGTVMNIGGRAEIGSALTLNDNTHFSLDPTQSFNVVGHSQRNFHFEKALKISSPLMADRTYDIPFRLGSNLRQSQIRFSFPEILELFYTTDDLKLRGFVRDSIVMNIHNEWENNNGIWQRDLWEEARHNPDVSYLGQLVNSSKRGNLDTSDLYRRIRSLSRSGTWLHYNKDYSFTTLLDEMGG